MEFLSAVIGAVTAAFLAAIGGLLQLLYKAQKQAHEKEQKQLERIDRRMTRLEGQYDLHLITAHDFRPTDGPFVRRHDDDKS